MKSGKFKLEGRDVFYIHNEIEKPIAFVFIHGRNQTAKTWEDSGTLGFLADNGISAVSINLPKYLSKYGYDTELQPETWLKEVYNQLHITNPILVSASTGSECALPFFLSNPKRVIGFIGIGCTNLKQYAKFYPKVNTPVVSVCGEKDTQSFKDSGKIFSEKVRRGEYVEIKDSGHYPHLEKPEEFHELLLKYFNQLI